MPLFVLSLCLLAGSALRAAPLTVLTENYPPFNYADDRGTPRGLSTEIVQLLLTSAGQPYHIEVVPWARAMLLAHTQANHCVFSLSRIPERETSYRWIGPLVINDWALFARRNAPVPAGLDALRHSTIGSYQGDAIVSYLQSRGYEVDVAPTDDLNPRKLLIGHLDYWATGKLIGLAILQQQGLQREIQPVLVFNRTEMYLGCSNQTPSSLIDALNNQLRKLRSNGDIERINARYGYHFQSLPGHD